MISEQTGLQGFNYIREGEGKWTQVNLVKVITMQGSRWTGQGKLREKQKTFKIKQEMLDGCCSPGITRDDQI